MYRKIANKAYKVLPLQNAEISLQEYMKSKIIRITLPSVFALLLKPNSSSQFNIWYNNLKYSVTNIQINKKLDNYNQALSKLECSISTIDKKIVNSLFTGTKVILQTQEGMAAVFENLTAYKPEYKYLVDLYGNLQVFDTMCKLQRFSSALSCAEEILDIITNFDLKKYSDKYDKQLEEDVKNMMSSIIDKKIIDDIQIKLENFKITDISKINDIKLFNELSSNLLEKIESIRTEIRINKRALIPIQDLKLLMIPINYYKKANQLITYNMQEFLNISPSRRKLYNVHKAVTYTPKKQISTTNIISKRIKRSNSTEFENIKGKRNYEVSNRIFDM